MFKVVGILAATPLLLSFMMSDSSYDRKETDACVTAQNRKTKTARKGDWGGDHIRLEVTDQGGQVEYDCAHGTIDQRIVLDAQGRFNVSGTHVREHGGPVRKGETENHQRVQFSGQIRDNKMTLKVSETDTGESLGTFTLVYGASTRLMKCR